MRKFTENYPLVAQFDKPTSPFTLIKVVDGKPVATFATKPESKLELMQSMQENDLLLVTIPGATRSDVFEASKEQVINLLYAPIGWTTT